MVSEDELRKMYCCEGLSLSQIADQLDLSSGSAVLYWMRKYDIPRRSEGGNRADYASYFIGKQKYARWADWVSGERIAVHQLLAIADGESPYDVFDEDKVVHHKSGHPRDNRIGNVEVMDRTDHNKIHSPSNISDRKAMLIQSVNIEREQKA